MNNNSVWINPWYIKRFSEDSTQNCFITKFKHYISKSLPNLWISISWSKNRDHYKFTGTHWEFFFYPSKKLYTWVTLKMWNVTLRLHRSLNISHICGFKESSFILLESLTACRHLAIFDPDKTYLYKCDLLVSFIPHCVWPMKLTRRSHLYM